MDDNLRLCLWTVTCGGLGIVLGGAFGALAAVSYSRSGGAAGTRFGRHVADTFARLGEREPSPLVHSALVGAADGIFFLGFLGALAGALVATVGKADPRWLGVAALGSTLLVGAAVFFGLLAYGLAHRGAGAALFVFVGGLLGSLSAGWLFGPEESLFGTLPGLAAGFLLARLVRPYTPTFTPPRVGKESPYSPSAGGTDITRPHHGHEDDSFRKPHSFEEE